MKPVKHIDPSPNNLSGTDWRILGELELTIGEEADGIISAWVTEILNPLCLHADFLNKVLKSAQDAAERAMQSENRQLDFEHIHLLIFFPGTRSSKRQTWGFFRIEKVGTPKANKNPYDHSIEFYLYPEGQ